jgi:peptide/nickel transport system permease protein
VYAPAARGWGARIGRTRLNPVRPTARAPLIVLLTFTFASAVRAVANLSFRGRGPAPPTPTWGNIIAEGRQYIREAPWITLFPGIAVAMTVLGLNLLGDGLRDGLDPRMRVQQS